MCSMYRVGLSKDIHRLVADRKLIICGVTIPFNLGEDAHSDGDVAYHAIGEAILGALALGDLGTHFPDSDEKYKNIDSGVLLDKIYSMMDSCGYEINNIDVLISLEKPKLSPYIALMRSNVASHLKTDVSNVSIKAGTNEKMDAVGQGQAIESFAYILLKKK